MLLHSALVAGSLLSHNRSATPLRILNSVIWASHGAVCIKEIALLAIDPSWELPTSETRFRWERWPLILKLAILAKKELLLTFFEKLIHAKCNSRLNQYKWRMWEMTPDKWNVTFVSRTSAWLNKKFEVVGILCGPPLEIMRPLGGFTFIIESRKGGHSTILLPGI